MGAKIILTGFAVLLFTTLYDVIVERHIIYSTIFLVSYGMLFFILTQIFFLALKFVMEHKENLSLSNNLVTAKKELEDLNENLENIVKERTEEISAANEEMQKINFTLNVARDALWGELELAKKIQTVLLPDNPIVPGYEIATHMDVAENVGGDYYDIINTEKKNWVIIGDVSGHGVPAGLVMMMVQSCIRTLVMEYPDIKPSELLRIVNNSIAYNIKNLKEEKFMTITAFAFDSNGKAIFSGRHEDILIYRKNGTVDVIKTDGICISKFPLGTNDKNSELQLYEGEVLLLYTDGIIEAFDGNNEMFSIKKLVSILENTGNLSASEILENIKDNVKDYEIHDDVALLILKKM
jgi:serine phosphatase RsbU (regulator of sigma subunit)